MADGKVISTSAVPSSSGMPDDSAEEQGRGAEEARPLKGEPDVKVVESDPSSTTPWSLVRVKVRGKAEERWVSKKSLLCLGVNNGFRQKVILWVEWKWFDVFILSCIIVNSLFLGIYQYRAEEHEDHYWLNQFIDGVAEVFFMVVFTIECVLKIIAWGVWPYLRDPWNKLDFLVVVSGLVERLFSTAGLGFLRLFRLLRPLRSLNAVPQLKVLVNTIIKSSQKLGNVIVLGGFLYIVFGIVGVSLMSGVFYRQCHERENPELRVQDNCWEWPLVEGSDRQCGGRYMCEDGQFCGGHELDTDPQFAPKFPDGLDGPFKGGPYPWCEGHEPKKLDSSTDFVHFDNIGAALLLVFQCMTLEGWTDIMYLVEDAFPFPWFAVAYFFLIVLLTNFFMLNVALAVVDEVQDEEAEEAEAAEAEEEGKEKETGSDDSGDRAATSDIQLEEELWYDCTPVRFCDSIAQSEIFLNFIMFIIFLNVLNMMVEFFSLAKPFGWVELSKMNQVLEYTFLAIFIIEMIIMLIAKGPLGYVRDPITAFDGFVVISSIIEVILNNTSEDGGGGGISALRTFRLFRVMNKLAKKWSQLNVLLKAMLRTGAALNYWLILFVLVLYIFTLMFIQVFHKQFRVEEYQYAGGIYKGEPWCRLENGQTTETFETAFRQDCIPRANFDTFTWGIVTVFQIMTGENWNTIMYDGMRASQRWDLSFPPPTVLSSFLFIVIILFGQTLFLSLFLSILISKFGNVRDEIQDEMKRKKSLPGSRHLKKSGVSMMFDKFRGNNEKETCSSQKPNQKEEDKEAGGSNPRLQLADETNKSPQLPGQLVDPREDDKPELESKTSQKQHETEEEVDDNEEEKPESSKDPKHIPDKDQWPKGYAWFVLSDSNPVRMGAKWILAKKVTIWAPSWQPEDAEEQDSDQKGKPSQNNEPEGTRIQAFDNFILVCILLSTLCMMIDSPLRDPEETLTIIVRFLDKYVFTIIFIIEMLVKLVALGLFWGPDAYLKSGWNWLDGIVVLVSIADLAFMGEGPGFFKVLRILRTFRPLRVISRNEGLKLVVQTLFQSMGDLLGLIIVFSLFLLIFALIFLMNLKGKLYQCTPGDNDIGYLGESFGHLGDDFTTPLCLSSDSITAWDGEAWAPAHKMHGVFDGVSGANTRRWNASSCPGSYPTKWKRATADTPICIARCNPSLESHNSNMVLPDKLTPLCAPKYTKVEELPHNCPASKPRTPSADEVKGLRYIADMKRALVVPCGGTTVQDGQVEDVASAVSCMKNFCPTETMFTKDECKDDCRIHKDFCKTSCTSEESEDTPQCKSCLRECEAACMCQDYCTPLIKDAALCLEQGGTWDQAAEQNFDNIVNAALTLFEISTTEGWVDVMYAASDSRGAYEQPIRDSIHGLYILLFPLWILLSFMFLINLAVGVIVDNFMQLKEQMMKSGKTILMTDAQKRWVESRRKLLSRRTIFDLKNLHQLGKTRRQVYDFVTHKAFENTIMASIVLNTIIMALAYFPNPHEWWTTTLMVFNYIFAVIYTVEAILKIYAFHRNYFMDNWNRFDFFCVFSTLLGILLKHAFKIDLGAATSVIRILRIARLFRLLRFLKELNRLFMCLFISIPKLFNVGAILILFLILFSILGMSLFGTAKFPDDGTLNSAGNFQDFYRSFITLFRASTGEAWNSIMHDLTYTEAWYFQHDDWCAPQKYFRPTKDVETYKILEDKCLMDEPNACPGDHNPLAAIFWVCYTFIITHTIMQLVVAVILEGYEEGKQKGVGDDIDMCTQIWKRFDENNTGCLDVERIPDFINDTIRAIKERDGMSEKGQDRRYDMAPRLTQASMADPSSLKMKDLRGLSISVDDNKQVTYHNAFRQVLRYTAAPEMTEEALRDLDNSDKMLPRREKTQMLMLERKASQGRDFTQNTAVVKIQQKFRQNQSKKGLAEEGCHQRSPRQESPQPEVIEESSMVRAPTRQMSAEPSGILPPRAG